MPCFNAYHVLLSVDESDSEALDSLINRVDEQIRVIKSLSPFSFTLDDLYNELGVMAIIRALPHSFDDIVCIISVLDKFNKQSSNHSATWTTHARTCLLPPLPLLHLQLLPDPLQMLPNHQHHPLLPLLPRTCKIGPLITSNATSACALAILRPNASSRRSWCIRYPLYPPPQLHLHPLPLNPLLVPHSLPLLPQQVPCSLLPLQMLISLLGTQITIPRTNDVILYMRNNLL